VIREIPPSVYKETSNVTITHFAEAVANRTCAVTVGDAVTGKHNDLVVVHIKDLLKERILLFI
jgi:hypothetical protein